MEVCNSRYCLFVVLIASSMICLTSTTMNVTFSNQSESSVEVIPPIFSDYIVETFVDAEGKQELLLDASWGPINRGEDETTGGISEKCCHYLDVFTNATTKFMQCVMTNARPLHYCANCVDEYTSVKNSYGDIINETNTPDNKTSCKEQLLRADNVQVVLLAHNFVEDVWSKSSCVKCYTAVVTKNSTIKFKPTNNTLEMLKEINSTLSCMEDFTQAGKTLGESVCTLCRELYNEANSFYEDLEDKGLLCSDLIDSMNYTRLMWSRKFNCTIIERSIEKVIGISVAIAFLPLILYSSAYIWGQKTKRHRRHTGRRTRGNTASNVAPTSESAGLLHDHHS